jgi:hypothetical protein
LNAFKSRDSQLHPRLDLAGIADIIGTFEILQRHAKPLGDIPECVTFLNDVYRPVRLFGLGPGYHRVQEQQKSQNKAWPPTSGTRLG